MPIYEYSCEKCGDEFEELVLSSEAEPDCPKCGQEGCKRLISVSRGGANSKGGTGLPADFSGGSTEGCGGSGGGFS